jgi:hypothetical protein
MRSALLAYLWRRVVPGNWLPRRGWRGWMACLCWRESWKREEGLRCCLTAAPARRYWDEGQ